MGTSRDISDEGGGAFTSESAAKVPGYRKLSENELSLIAETKELEARWNALVDKIRSTRSSPEGHRQIAIAATEGEAAFMRAVRAVALPERLLP